jgi:hypothetical protein
MRTATVLLFFGLVSCATPYQAHGAAGGYSDLQLAENVFRVSFNANGYTSSEKAADFALLRSAELAAEHGFKYFVIVSAKSDEEVSQYTSPTTTYSTGSRTASTSTTTGGQTYSITKPGTTNTILCYREKPDGFSFETALLISNIRAKYGLPAR